MSDRLDELDYYTLLQVPPDANADAIRAAFHRFALKYHPDNHGATPDALTRSTQIFRRGAEAYRVLSDMAMRRRYDEGLREGKLRLSAEREERRARQRSVSSVTSLKARPFWQKAQDAMKAGKWKQAKLNLQVALQHEPDSALLKEQLAQVETRLGGD